MMVVGNQWSKYMILLSLICPANMSNQTFDQDNNDTTKIKFWPNGATDMNYKKNNTIPSFHMLPGTHVWFSDMDIVSSDVENCVLNISKKNKRQKTVNKKYFVDIDNGSVVYVFYQRKPRNIMKRNVDTNINPTMHEIYVHRGKSTLLPCVPPYADINIMDSTVVWIKDNKPIVDSRFSVTESGNLYVEDVEPKDMGAYTCVMEGLGLSEQHVTRKFKHVLKIFVMPELSYKISVKYTVASCDESIKQNKVNSLRSEMCTLKECLARNIEGSCHTVAKSSGELEVFKHELWVSLQIMFQLKYNDSCSGISCLRSVALANLVSKEKLVEFYFKSRENLVSSPAMEFINSSLSKTLMHPCLPGYRLGDSVCIPCLPGTYSEHLDNIALCLPCPVGKYQPEFAMAKCFNCDKGFSTKKTGSNNSVQCVKQIPANRVSVNVEFSAKRSDVAMYSGISVGVLAVLAGTCIAYHCVIKRGMKIGPQVFPSPDFKRTEILPLDVGLKDSRFDNQTNINEPRMPMSKDSPAERVPLLTKDNMLVSTFSELQNGRNKVDLTEKNSSTRTGETSSDNATSQDDRRQIQQSRKGIAPKMYPSSVRRKTTTSSQSSGNAKHVKNKCYHSRKIYGENESGSTSTVSTSLSMECLQQQSKNADGHSIIELSRRHMHKRNDSSISPLSKQSNSKIYQNARNKHSRTDIVDYKHDHGNESINKTNVIPRHRSHGDNDLIENISNIKEQSTENLDVNKITSLDTASERPMTVKKSYSVNSTLSNNYHSRHTNGLIQSALQQDEEHRIKQSHTTHNDSYREFTQSQSILEESVSSPHVQGANKRRLERNVLPTNTSYLNNQVHGTLEQYLPLFSQVLISNKVCDNTVGINSNGKILNMATANNSDLSTHSKHIQISDRADSNKGLPVILAPSAPPPCPPPIQHTPHRRSSVTRTGDRHPALHRRSSTMRTEDWHPSVPPPPPPPPPPPCPPPSPPALHRRPSTMRTEDWHPSVQPPPPPPPPPCPPPSPPALHRRSSTMRTEDWHPSVQPPPPPPPPPCPPPSPPALHRRSSTMRKEEWHPSMAPSPPLPPCPPPPPQMPLLYNISPRFTFSTLSSHLPQTHKSLSVHSHLMQGYEHMKKNIKTKGVVIGESATSVSTHSSHKPKYDMSKTGLKHAESWLSSEWD